MDTVIPLALVLGLIDAYLDTAFDEPGATGELLTQISALDELINEAKDEGIELSAAEQARWEQQEFRRRELSERSITDNAHYREYTGAGKRMTTPTARNGRNYQEAIASCSRIVEG